jgi:hypothetical protein
MFYNSEKSPTSVIYLVNKKSWGMPGEIKYTRMREQWRVLLGDQRMENTVPFNDPPN